MEPSRVKLCQEYFSTSMVSHKHVFLARGCRVCTRVVHTSGGDIDVSQTSFLHAKPKVHVFKEHKVLLVKTSHTVKGGTVDHQERTREPTRRSSLTRGAVAKIGE